MLGRRAHTARRSVVLFSKFTASLTSPVDREAMVRPVEASEIVGTGSSNLGDPSCRMSEYLYGFVCSTSAYPGDLEGGDMMRLRLKVEVGRK